MKILLVHNFYQSTHVGGEDLVFEQENKALMAALGADNVFTYSVANDNLNKFKLVFTIWYNFTHAKKIHQLIKKHNIHIMHVHNYFPLLTPGIFKAAKTAGAKVVYTLHNYREWCLSGLFYRKNKPECYDCAQLKLPTPGIKNACYRSSKLQSVVAGVACFFYKKTKHLDYVDKFFVLSDTQQKILQQIKTPIIIKTKIKPSFVQNLQPKKNLDFSARKNYVFVGRLEEIKGIDVLLAVWQKLDARFVLEVIGSGLSQQHLKQKYKNNHNIVFLGKQPREQVLKKMGQAKYVIHPGIVQETQGLTILESMAQSTPVIGFAIGTRKEYIQDNYNGFLGNVSNLKEMIINAEEIFVTKPDDYALLCEQAALSVQPYLPEPITLKQLELYRALCPEGDE